MYSLFAFLLVPFVGVLADGLEDTVYFVFNIEEEGEGED